MNEFEKRWRECAERARQEARADEQAPAGFASRVLALSKGDEKESASPADILYRMTLRTLGCATTLLVALIVLEASSSRSGRMKVPHIENTVAQIFWLL